MKFVFLVLLLACQKEPTFTKEQLLSMAEAADSTVTLVLPRSISEGVSCDSYAEGCLSAHIVKVQGLDLIAVEFKTTEEAIYAAKKVRGLYSRNWLFDDVADEPKLAEFVTKHLEAKKP